MLKKYWRPSRNTYAVKKPRCFPKLGCFSHLRSKGNFHTRACVMPLKLLEHVSPWLVWKLSDDDASSSLQNMLLAAVVTRFSGWACKVQDKSNSREYLCLKSGA